MGFIRGTESLLKNTLVGTVATLNRFTTTVADGISVLAMVEIMFLIVLFLHKYLLTG